MKKVDRGIALSANKLGLLQCLSTSVVLLMLKTGLL